MSGIDNTAGRNSLTNLRAAQAIHQQNDAEVQALNVPGAAQGTGPTSRFEVERVEAAAAVAVPASIAALLSVQGRNLV